jgi:hypothetical protein
MAVVGLFPESSGTDDPDFELHLGEEVLRKGPGTVREWSEDGPKRMPEQLSLLQRRVVIAMHRNQSPTI